MRDDAVLPAMRVAAVVVVAVLVPALIILCALALLGLYRSCERPCADASP